MWTTVSDVAGPIIAGPLSEPALLASSISFGLAGSISTVSTLMKEADEMEDWKAFLYVSCSIACGIAIAVVILFPLFYLTPFFIKYG